MKKALFGIVALVVLALLVWQLVLKKEIGTIVNDREVMVSNAHLEVRDVNLSNRPDQVAQERYIGYRLFVDFHSQSDQMLYYDDMVFWGIWEDPRLPITGDTIRLGITREELDKWHEKLLSTFDGDAEELFQAIFYTDDGDYWLEDYCDDEENDLLVPRGILSIEPFLEAALTEEEFAGIFSIIRGLKHLELHSYFIPCDAIRFHNLQEYIEFLKNEAIYSVVKVPLSVDL